MIETDKIISKRSIINQQLFSEAYLRELCSGKFSFDAAEVCLQIIREWREAYPSLEDGHLLRQYVGQCLSALRVSYTPQQNLYILHTDETKSNQTGICLIVNDVDLGCTTKGRHHQANLIKQLRNATLHWGIITNGRNWRLCHAVAAAPYEVFLEIDLDRILQKNDLSEFLLFYLFFGQPAFTIVQSKDINAQQIGLDRYLEESEKRIEAIQRYLRSQVEPILQSLCLGFVQDEAVGSYTRETLDEIYRNAIFLLYRILFLFYAETRGLLPTQDANYQHIGLAGILEDARLHQQEGIHDPDPFSLWKRLTHLFVVVDDGDESVGVRPYNGGLFSDREKPYLKTHRITNAYLAQALFELGYMQRKAGIYPVDYCDLTVRHLGTLYEGLLEYRLNLVSQEPVVVRENKGNRIYIPRSQAGVVKRTETILEVGEVYFADDKGERKSSGSFDEILFESRKVGAGGKEDHHEKPPEGGVVPGEKQRHSQGAESSKDEQRDEQNDEGHHEEQTSFSGNKYDGSSKGACDEQAIGEQQGGEGQQQGTQDRDQGSGRETPRLSYQHVQEKPTRLREETNQQHQTYEQLETAREGGLGQISVVQQGHDKQNSGMGVTSSEVRRPKGGEPGVAAYHQPQQRIAAEHHCWQSNPRDEREQSDRVHVFSPPSSKTNNQQRQREEQREGNKLEPCHSRLLSEDSSDHPWGDRFSTVHCVSQMEKLHWFQTRANPGRGHESSPGCHGALPGPLTDPKTAWCPLAPARSPIPRTSPARTGQGAL
jgi:hypothetical protein